MSREIEEIVTQFNKSWQENDITILNRIMHEQVAFIAPDLKTMIKGREACVRTIEDYISKALTHNFQMRIETIHFVEQVAWVTLRYEIDYEINKQRYREQGEEIWGLIRQQSQWRIGWRCLVRNEARK